MHILQRDLLNGIFQIDDSADLQDIGQQSVKSKKSIDYKSSDKNGMNIKFNYGILLKLASFENQPCPLFDLQVLAPSAKVTKCTENLYYFCTQLFILFQLYRSIEKVKLMIVYSNGVIIRLAEYCSFPCEYSTCFDCIASLHVASSFCKLS